MNAIYVSIEGNPEYKTLPTKKILCPASIFSPKLNRYTYWGGGEGEMAANSSNLSSFQHSEFRGETKFSSPAGDP